MLPGWAPAALLSNECSPVLCPHWHTLPREWWWCQPQGFAHRTPPKGMGMLGQHLLGTPPLPSPGGKPSTPGIKDQSTWILLILWQWEPLKS